MVSTFRFGSTFVHHLTESNFFHAFPRRIIQLYTWDSTTGKFYLVAWRLVQTRDYPLNVGELAGRVGPADSGKAGVTDLSYLHIVFTEAAEVAMALGVPQGLAKHLQTLGPPTFDSDLGPACPVYPGGRAAQVVLDALSKFDREFESARLPRLASWARKEYMDMFDVPEIAIDEVEVRRVASRLDRLHGLRRASFAGR